MKNHYRKNKTAIRFALTAWLLLMLLVWLLPVAFCGYLNDDADTSFWYFLSESGGVYGTTILALILCSVAAFQQNSAWHKIRAFVAGFGFLLITLGGIAALNEYVIKPITQVPRPSHLYLLTEANQLPQFYGQSITERQIYLQNYIQLNPEKYAYISPLVLAHWVQECGYSFPSGHSQNAFLLGTMLAIWLGLQLPRRKQVWLILPLGWAMLVCMSRVALGVHSELDVSLGAGFGLLMAYLLSLTGIMHRVFKITQPEN
ncbi:phosphatase PAP2 family protein [Pontibacter sp. H249]|uniref:phosphatase PAP2 family protein n=1 Tax=Pontibacter sp. H249 TaxID=3133420 RepID=UPI0030C086E2